MKKQCWQTNHSQCRWRNTSGFIFSLVGEIPRLFSDSPAVIYCDIAFMACFACNIVVISAAFNKCDIASVALILSHALSPHIFRLLPPQGRGVHSIVPIPAPWQRNHGHRICLTVPFVVRYTGQRPYCWTSCRRRVLILVRCLEFVACLACNIAFVAWVACDITFDASITCDIAFESDVWAAIHRGWPRAVTLSLIQILKLTV
jgi:hypothetical protein